MFNLMIVTQCKERWRIINELDKLEVLEKLIQSLAETSSIDFKELAPELTDEQSSQI